MERKTPLVSAASDWRICPNRTSAAMINRPQLTLSPDCGGSISRPHFRAVLRQFMVSGANKRSPRFGCSRRVMGPCRRSLLFFLPRRAAVLSAIALLAIRAAACHAQGGPNVGGQVSLIPTANQPAAQELPVPMADVKDRERALIADISEPDLTLDLKPNRSKLLRTCRRWCGLRLSTTRSCRWCSSTQRSGVDWRGAGRDEPDPVVCRCP